MTLYDYSLDFIENGLFYGFCMGVGLQILGYAIDKSRQTLLTIMTD